jgi:hypothetical protein
MVPSIPRSPFFKVLTHITRILRGGCPDQRQGHRRYSQDRLGPETGSSEIFSGQVRVRVSVSVRVRV